MADPSGRACAVCGGRGRTFNEEHREPRAGLCLCNATFEVVDVSTSCVGPRSSSVASLVDLASSLVDLASLPLPLLEATPPLPPSTPPQKLPPGLILVCADDDPMARIMATALLDYVAADMAHSRVLGESYAEVANLASEMAALEAQWGSDRVLLVIDENMSFDEGDVAGTAVSRELRSVHGFDGAIIIHSADDSERDRAHYRSCGADGSTGKSVVGGSVFSAMTQVLIHAHHCRQQGRALRKTRPPAGEFDTLD